jgi:prepilin-type N-terminal cleavage/methylation domain-containing protein
MCGLNHDRQGRTGFTLVELLVVMVIIIILATLAVALVPRVNEQQKATNAAGQVSGWALISKQRAKRDRHPVGLRLQAPIVAVSSTPVVPGPATITYTPWDPLANKQAGNQALPDGTLWMIVQGSYLLIADDDQGSNAEQVSVTGASGNTFTAGVQKAHPTGFRIRHLGYVQTLQYIEQPEDFTVPAVPLPPPGQPPYFGEPGGAQVRRIKVTGGNTADLEDPASPLPPGTIPPDFSGGLGWQPTSPNPTPDPSQSSQWPVQPGDYLQLFDGQVHQIARVETDPTNQYYAKRLILQVPMTNQPNTTDQYRIIRGPRVLRGEADLQLPRGVVIDLGTNLKFNATFPLDPMAGTIDILFAPSGAVVGRAVQGTGTILLWVRDTGSDDLANPTYSLPTGNITRNEPALVAVYPRTGFIATHPVDTSSGNPYSFTQDGRSSGM